jgi:RNA polymerase sigma-70 factor (ECF subfamily)
VSTTWDAAAAASAAMERYARGNDAAFGELYDALAPRLHGYLRHHCRDAARAEDLLQQSFLHLHRARGTFIAGADVVPWAFAIARRLLIDSVRRQRRAPSVELDGEAAPELASLDAGQDEMAEAAELEACLRRAFAKLPESQRTAFDLVKREGLTFKQAAEALGTTVAAVKLRAQRAYDALRAAVVAHRGAAAQGGPP